MIDFEQELITPLKSMSEEVIGNYITQWTQEITNWIIRAKAYIRQTEGLKNKLSDYNIKRYDEWEAMLKNRRIARDKLLNKTILQDGYILLNKIGEIVRGETIKYSITVTKTGAAIQESHADEIYTTIVPLSEFLNYMSFTSQRIILRDSSALYKMIEQQIDQNNQSIKYEKWTDEKLQQFALFRQEVLASNQWGKVNNGNILEAFLRFLTFNKNVIISPITPNLRSKIYASMVATMKSPDKFFEGGDINDLQIKGLNASITNLNTLLKNLNDTLSILKAYKFNQEVLKKYMRKKHINEHLNNTADETIESIVNKLIEFFTSGIDR